jgi:hypothetical protein
MSSISNHYDGKVTLAFDEKAHIYTATERGVTRESFGVTTVLSVISKPALVPWAAKMTAEYVRENLKPGVGLNEVEIATLCELAKGAHRKKKEAAGDIGKLAHAWVENLVKSGERPEFPEHEQARHACLAFVTWMQQHEVRFLKSEFRVYSRKHNYAGTADGVAIIDGCRTLFDLKTGSCYPEHGLQLAAYQIALEEEYPRGKIEKRTIVSIKKDGLFETKDFLEYEKDAKAFVNALELYQRTKEWGR